MCQGRCVKIKIIKKLHQSLTCPPHVPAPGRYPHWGSGRGRCPSVRSSCSGHSSPSPLCVRRALTPTSACQVEGGVVGGGPGVPGGGMSAAGTALLDRLECKIFIIYIF